MQNIDKLDETFYNNLPKCFLTLKESIENGNFKKSTRLIKEIKHFLLKKGTLKLQHDTMNIIKKYILDKINEKFLVRTFHSSYNINVTLKQNFSEWKITKYNVNNLTHLTQKIGVLYTNIYNVSRINRLFLIKRKITCLLIKNSSNYLDKDLKQILIKIFKSGYTILAINNVLNIREINIKTHYSRKKDLMFICLDNRIYKYIKKTIIKQGKNNYGY